jgi:hypothetical protein
MNFACASLAYFIFYFGRKNIFGELKHAVIVRISLIQSNFTAESMTLES